MRRAGGRSGAHIAREANRRGVRAAGDSLDLELQCLQDLDGEEVLGTPRALHVDDVTATPLRISLTRRLVRPGRGDGASAWMAALHERQDECVASLARDGLALEVVFHAQEGDDGTSSTGSEFAGSPMPSSMPNR